uniref:Uncharacterized protein n=1 Tax=Arundo donax TaxID=35708 RepID=A0A0A9GKG4_ARUDO
MLSKGVKPRVTTYNIMTLFHGLFQIGRTEILLQRSSISR